jgi:hypothetical protein
MGIEEKFERVAANPSGFKDLSDHAKWELAALTDIPMTLLGGESPSGLNTDGESWWRMWCAVVAARQEERYRQPLETIIEILYHSEGAGLPKTWDLTFNPLGEMTDRERAEIRKLLTEADSMAIMDGVLRPRDAQSRYTQPGGFAFELQPVEDEDEEIPGGAEVEEEVRRMVEEAQARAAEPAPGEPKTDAETYKLPEAARNNARKVLRWREEHPDEIKGMTEVGWRRARQLANNAEVGIDTVRKMAAFNRHRENAEVAEEFKSTPWKDAGRVAWLGWGGSAGINWARGITGASDE